MKLLFTDLDGTLLNDDGSISQENLSAIRRAAEKGNLTVITTGRSLSSAFPYIRQLKEIQQPCYAITYNGGLIYDCTREEILYKRTIPLPYVKYIFAQAEKFDIHCQTYENGTVLAPRDRTELREYQEHSCMPVKIDPLLLEHLKEEPVKVLTSCLSDREHHDRYRRSLTQWAKGKVSVFFSNEHYLEHVPEATSKGGAILWLCRQLGVPVENTVAAGDAENDITMLATAHVGVCMANGAAEVRQQADYITLCDNNHGGIREIIEKFIENS